MAQDLTTNKTEAVALRVTNALECRAASNAAKRLARNIGFGSVACEEISVVASELASNVVRHAGGGEITASPVEGPGKTGIQIFAEDQGPGIVDVELALKDGYSTAGGLGVGLGAVNRLMDELQFSSGRHGGLRVVCQRWIRPETSVSPGSLIFGVATRPYRMLQQNGDAFVIRQWENHALAGVIDGLGHGEFAQRASHAARQYLEAHFDQPFDILFEGVGRACRATRGVVLSLVRFDVARARLSTAGIGNIEVCLGDRGGKRFTPMIRRGILGQANAPKPVSTELPWNNDSLLVIHSDGIQSRWKWPEITAGETPEELARQLVRNHGRIDDDATVIVAKSVERPLPIQR